MHEPLHIVQRLIAFIPPDLPAARSSSRGLLTSKPVLDAQGIVFGQKIGVDAGHADQGARGAVGAAGVHRHPPAAVLQAVAGSVRLGHCLRGKAQGRGGVGLRPGGALGQRQLWQRHPEQTEYNGEYAKPVEQADRQLAHKKHSLPR